MNSNHTPGPWRIGDAGKTVFGPPIPIGLPKIIAKINYLPMPCKVSDIDQSIANSRLIAAAPELLQSLKFILDRAGRGGSAALSDIESECLAAIAKASK